MKSFAPFHLAMCLLFCSVASTRAADVPGSKDPAFLKRYEGSEIIGYTTKSFVEYALPGKPINGAPFGTDGAKVEGALVRILYRVPTGHTALELLRNYEHTLGEAGFALLNEYKPFNDNVHFTFRDGFWMQAGSMGQPFINGRDISYVVAKATKDGQDLTVAVLAVESAGGSFNKEIKFESAGGKFSKDITIKPGEMIVGVDVVTAKAVEINMVAVKSDVLAKALAETGKVDIYGINFDVDKTDIKPTSAPTLEQVAKLLKDDPALKLEVAGHTDNAGDKDHNAKLSDGRAAAVVQSLVKTHGIDAARLQAKGYGDTKPVAPNDTDAGKAKNRRVELRKI